MIFRSPQRACAAERRIDDNAEPDADPSRSLC